TITFTVTFTPTDIEPGGHYGALRVRSVPHRDESTGMVAHSRTQFIIPILASQPNDQVLSLSAGSPTLALDNGAVRMGVPVSNTGNTHIRPQISAVVRNTADGTVIGTVDEMSSVFL